MFSYKDKDKALCPPGADNCNAELLEKGKDKLNTEYWQRSIEILEATAVHTLTPTTNAHTCP